MSDHEEVDGNSRTLQDFLDAAANIRPTESGNEAGIQTDTTTETTDDDEISYEPSTEEEGDEMHEFFEQIMEEEDETGNDEEEDDEDYEDAEEDLSTIEVEIEADDQETETEEPEPALAAARRRQVLRLLATSQLGRLFMGTGSYGRRRRNRPDPNRFPKIPQEHGTELMSSGDFGTDELLDASSMSSRKRLACRILQRELGLEPGPRQKINQGLMAQGMIPSSSADMIVNYDAPVYSGQFSDDGNFFYSCVKDFKVRMYDTSNPYKWRYYKTVNYPYGQWTLTDATLSPDNRYLAYTSIQPNVCLAPTDPNDMGDPYNLDLSDSGRRDRRTYRSRHGSFGIWSVRFSGDGRELVAGTSANSVVVYDIESRRTILEIPAHDEDVNAVCFGDEKSPHLLLSGSDDTTLKVWDRRSLGDSREAGAFVGHIEGLTYIDSKGDGRYFLSNGKDQSMKLWDLRMVMSTARFAEIDPSSYTNNFDYRWGDYDDDDWNPHPKDNSLCTYRGHKVLRTLIRCHFSPPGSTNSRYVYSGSADGKVYVYNLDATIAGIIDVRSATVDSRPFDRRDRQNGGWHMMDDGEFEDEDEDGGYNRRQQQQPRWSTCVRDASWHPEAPVIAASAWNGYSMSCGTVSAHSWNDGAEEDECTEPRMGISVDDKLRRTGGSGGRERLYAIGSYDRDEPDWTEHPMGA